MRLINADAEIAKIEQEIQKTLSQIKEWEDNREDRGGYHNVDAKIKQFKRNITQAYIEIQCLKNYSTAYDADKVMEQIKQSANVELVDDDYYRHTGEQLKAITVPATEKIIKAGGVNE